MLLLNKINTNLAWVENSNKDNDEQSQWNITSESSSLEFRNWLIKERERLVKEEMKSQVEKKSKSYKSPTVTFFIPTSNDTISE